MYFRNITMELGFVQTIQVNPVHLSTPLPQPPCATPQHKP